MLEIYEKLHATEKNKIKKSKSKRQAKTEMTTRHGDVDDIELAVVNCRDVLRCNSATVRDTNRRSYVSSVILNT